MSLYRSVSRLLPPCRRLTSPLTSHRSIVTSCRYLKDTGLHQPTPAGPLGTWATLKPRPELQVDTGQWCWWGLGQHADASAAAAAIANTCVT